MNNRLFDVEEAGKELKIYIKSKLKVYRVAAVGKAQIVKEEFCASRLEFTVKKDDTISFDQGDAVSVKLGDEGLFFGYVFSKSRDKNSLIEVVAYDQLRYMKNKVCYYRTSSTLEEVIYSLKSKYNFSLGQVDRCSYALPPMAGQSVALLDVVKKACSDVFKASGEKYILYDDFGYLSLRNEENMVTNVMIDSSQSENYIYTDTIDKGVYNKIIIYNSSRRWGDAKIEEYADKESIEKWGELSYTMKADAYTDYKREAENLLKEYSKVNREIVLKGTVGNGAVIPGSRVYVKLVMGDISLNGFMRVKKAIHSFENNLYKTDVYLDGSEIA